MLNENKPWVKYLFENFLITLTISALILTRIAGKMINGRFELSNLIVLAFAIVGLILLIVSKIASFKNGNYFSFGSVEMSSKDKIIYKISYVLMIVGLMLTFLL